MSFMVPLLQGSRHEGLTKATKLRCLCRRFEVPTPPAANSVRNFKSKSGTRTIELLVPLCFRSSCQSVLRCITNFGNGALARRLAARLLLESHLDDLAIREGEQVD